MSERDDQVESSDLRVGFIEVEGASRQAVIYAASDGQALFQGDVVLGTVAEIEAELALHRLVGQLQPITPHRLKPALGFLHPNGAGVEPKSKLWSSRVIPYVVESSATSTLVSTAITKWQNRTSRAGLHFEFRPRASTDSDYIAFVTGGGPRSQVGRQGGRQTVTLEAGTSVGSAMHEICHAVGLHHEVSRLDRINFVDILWSNIRPGGEINFQQYNVGRGRDLGDYDYESIMHYPASAFALPGTATIRPRRPSAKIGQREDLSDGDVAALKALYV